MTDFRTAQAAADAAERVNGRALLAVAFVPWLVVIGAALWVWLL